MIRTRYILLVSLILAFAILATFLLPRLTRAQGENHAVSADVYADLSPGFTYQGYLEGSGKPADGSYNFRFYLWNDNAKTTLLATYPQAGTLPLTVSEGLFTVELDFGSEVFNGQELWLEIEVNGVSLSPLQQLTPAPYSLSLQPGAVISGTVPSPEGMLNLINPAGAGLVVSQAGGDGLHICRTGTETDCTSYDALHNGVEIGSAEQYGVWIDSAGSSGLHVQSAEYNGVQVFNAGYDGVSLYSVDDDGLEVCRTGSETTCDLWDDYHNGVEIGSTEHNGIYIDDAGTSGLYVGSAGAYGLAVGTSVKDGVYVDSPGDDFFQGGPDFDIKFRVSKHGGVYASSYNITTSDFAELMALAGDPEDYEPGDVLVISAAQDRVLALSAESYAKSVIGVYSTSPGIVGGSPINDTDLSGMAPVALLGIVPTKVSAENGPIQRGDLLVTSATPGHAMRSDEPPPGTVLGKALEPLESDTGMILVLVTLQ